MLKGGSKGGCTNVSNEKARGNSTKIAPERDGKQK